MTVVASATVSVETSELVEVTDTVLAVVGEEEIQRRMSRPLDFFLSFWNRGHWGTCGRETGFAEHFH